MTTQPTYLLATEIDAQIRQTCVALGLADLADRITWRWNSRLTRCLGIARLSKTSIDFSNRLFLLCSVEERRDTIIHEVCHLACRQLHGVWVEDHGADWKALMRKAGGNPKATAEAPAGASALRRGAVPVVCGCEVSYHVTPGMAAKMTRGARLSCRRCHHWIRLAGQPEVLGPVNVQAPRNDEELTALREQNQILREILRLRAENQALCAKVRKP